MIEKTQINIKNLKLLRLSMICTPKVLEPFPESPCLFTIILFQQIYSIILSFGQINPLALQNPSYTIGTGVASAALC